MLEPLRREYLEHLAQAQAGGMGETEALATLGDPKRVNGELRRTYGPATAWPVAGVAFHRVLWMQWLLPLATLGFAIGEMLPPGHLWLALALLLWLSLVWWSSARQGFARRVLWRQSGGTLTLYAYLGLTFSGATPGWNLPTLMLTLMLMLTLLGSWNLWDHEQKLRRIERLTGRRA